MGPVEPWNGSVTTWYSREFGEWNSNGYGAWLHASNLLPGLFSASSSWSSGADFKRRLLEYAQTCCVAVFMRDTSEGRVYLDEDGRPSIAYQYNEYDRRTMIKVCGSSGTACRGICRSATLRTEQPSCTYHVLLKYIAWLLRRLCVGRQHLAAQQTHRKTALAHE